MDTALHQPRAAEFAARVSPLLEAARPQSRLTVAGRISLIERRDLYGAGVIGVESVRAPRRKYWARLAEASDYQAAVRAHDETRAVRVSGFFLQEGNLRWLLHATVVEVLGRAAVREPANNRRVPDQLTLFPLDEPLPAPLPELLL
jgi:hypothetical protein